VGRLATAIVLSLLGSAYIFFCLFSIFLGFDLFVLMTCLLVHLYIFVDESESEHFLVWRRGTVVVGPGTQYLFRGFLYVFAYISHCDISAVFL
jgi:hypothetical protein